MPRRISLLLTVAALLIAPAIVTGCASSGGESGGSGELTVSAAASLETALTDYRKSMPAVDVKQTFAGSDLLATQIHQGARPDVFASADLVLPKLLHKQGLVGKPTVFASNRLVIAVPADSAIRRIGDLSEPGLKVLLGQVSVPIGSYADLMLAELPESESAKILANVVSREPDATSISAKMIEGAADAAILYRTDVKAAGKQLKAIPLPATLQPEIEYGAAVVKDSKQPQLARRYVSGLLSGAGARALHNAGFLPPR